MKKTIAFLMTTALLFCLSGCGEDKKDTSSTQTGTDTASAAEVTSEREKTELIGQDKFDQIQNGMTYEEVKAILGGDGVLMYSRGEAENKSEGYIWDGSNPGAVGSVIFAGGHVVSKTSAGLQ